MDGQKDSAFTYLRQAKGMFVSKLKERYPSLSNDEIQMCMLIRIGLSNEDMANIYCITINSMKRKLTVLRKRWALQTRTKP